MLPPPPPPVMARPVAIIRSTGNFFTCQFFKIENRLKLYMNFVADMNHSPPPSVSSPPLENSSASGRAPLSPVVVSSGGGLGGDPHHQQQHRGGSSGGGPVVSSSAAFGSGRDYTFSHLHAQSGQVWKAITNIVNLVYIRSGWRGFSFFGAWKSINCEYVRVLLSLFLFLKDGNT